MLRFQQVVQSWMLNYSRVGLRQYVAGAIKISCMCINLNPCSCIYMCERNYSFTRRSLKTHVLCSFKKNSIGTLLANLPATVKRFLSEVFKNHHSSSSVCLDVKIRFPLGHLYTLKRQNKCIKNAELHYVWLFYFCLQYNYPADISGSVVGESLDCLLLSGTVVSENPDHVCWVAVPSGKGNLESCNLKFAISTWLNCQSSYWGKSSHSLLVRKSKYHVHQVGS